MNPLFSAKPAPSWPVALALSLFLHVSLMLCPFFLSAQSSSGDNSRSLLIDTRTSAPATEIRLVLCERFPADQPVAAAPSVMVQETALIRQASPEYGASEEQEASPTTRTAASRSLAGPGTGKDTTAFFQIATQAKAIVYVIDRSGSMG